MNNPVTEDGYNFIYAKLVDDPDDILGKIAYSFYKQQKIEFIADYKDKFSREPSASDLEIFYLASNSAAAISSYKNKAETLARDFAEALFNEQLNENKERLERELIGKVKSLRPAFWQSVAQNLVASFIFVLVIGVIVFAAWSSQFSVSQALQQMMGVDFVSKNKSP
ncbi:hypothetical protein [Xanthomonas arboricola]|uniref:hypothetical protein n=1 Tax=Xanthomonas arboricola TaxID=56448 RepID=UPI0012DB1806|nr:hypothetical protein [Xanthomonas arboricola]